MNMINLFQADVDMDEENLIINGDKTYKFIKDKLNENGSVLIAWSDGIGTHLDILFTYNPVSPNWSLVQGGIRPYYLFVSVMKWSSFGFNTENSDKTAEYIMDKFQMPESIRDTAAKLAELINGVIKEIKK